MSKTPTEAGWYWAKLKTEPRLAVNLHWIVVSVVMGAPNDYPSPRGQFGLWAYHAHQEGSGGGMDLSDFEWGNKISEPETV